MYSPVATLDADTLPNGLTQQLLTFICTAQAKANQSPDAGA